MKFSSRMFKSSFKKFIHVADIKKHFILKKTKNMPNTYTQLYVQIVFPVNGRQNLLSIVIRERVFKYMFGIVEELDHKSIIVNAHSDHLHLFVGLNPKQSISNLVKAVKVSPSEFIKENKMIENKFEWKQGFGAFSCSKSQNENVYKYMLNQ